MLRLAARFARSCPRLGLPTRVPTGTRMSLPAPLSASSSSSIFAPAASSTPVVAVSSWSRGDAFAQPARSFSADAAPSEADDAAAASSRVYTPVQKPPPARDESVGRFSEAPMSVKKLTEICRLVRGLSVREALAQLRFASSTKAWIVANTIRNARTAGVHNFGMDEERMVVAECYATRAKSPKKLRYHSKGRTGIARSHRSHVMVKLRQVPEDEGEKRVGRAGVKHETLRRTKERLATIQEQEQ